MGWQVETDWLFPMLPEGYNRSTTNTRYRWRWTALLATLALHCPIGTRPIGIPLQSRLSPTPEAAQK